MSRWNTARIITETGRTYYKTPQEANRLLETKQARLVSRKPLIVERIAIISIRHTPIPIDCKRFIQEFKLAGSKPARAYEPIEEGYTPLPCGFGR